jgi:hypothetical protein
VVLSSAIAMVLVITSNMVMVSGVVVTSSDVGWSDECGVEEEEERSEEEGSGIAVVEGANVEKVVAGVEGAAVDRDEVVSSQGEVAEIVAVEGGDGIEV